MNKIEQYTLLANFLAPLWEKDLWLMEHEPEKWQKARDLDDQLVADKESTCSISAYRVRCLELRALYE